LHLLLTCSVENDTQGTLDSQQSFIATLPSLRFRVWVYCPPGTKKSAPELQNHNTSHLCGIQSAYLFWVHLLFCRG